ncbi:hypothetical protein CDD82_7301 [Ophiocordyceps australis]|uniref:Transmembrane protein 135 N-terminal domain-containing protein n=1 Tax=Ophiocordyceps australis TaxID=1399860 RepID=A0A2C5YT04_9HYPO|nr:hypothetical protein CDD82_7301 [Ophiocordyceps australis]
MASPGASAASAASADAAAGPRRRGRDTATADAVLRNTLRYTVSAKEYACLHRYILSKSRLVRRHVPSPASVERVLQQQQLQQQQQLPHAADSPGHHDYNARAVRHALRVLVVTWLGSKAWQGVTGRLRAGRDKATSPTTSPQLQSWPRSHALRLSLSLSTILVLYRLIFRFISRLRAQLLDAQAEPFRRRNPRTAAALTSIYAPAIGASLAGLGLGIYPSQQLRLSIAIFAMFRALEFGWNACEMDGSIWGFHNGRKRERPWWFGSWMLQPFANGQLLHACVFDRDCFPAAYGNFIFNNSSAYLHKRPRDWPASLKWPKTNEIVDSLAEMARLNWPPYISPTMFPTKEALPRSLQMVSPLTSRAHPLITSLSCATLHPNDPSCLRTYLTFWLDSFPLLARFFLGLYSALTIVSRFRTLHSYPFATLQRIISRALRMSAFVTGAISTAWASICFFQNYLPRHVLPTQRFFLGGFVAGLWAWLERRSGRAVFIYSARASVDSLYKVGVKRRWWTAMRGGEVAVFTLALMVTGVVYERDARAVHEAQWRKGISWLRGEDWRDWAVEDESDDDDDEGADEQREETRAALARRGNE